MRKGCSHNWAFSARLRRGAFGWRSSNLAITRIKEAISEIKKEAKKDPILGAEGAVVLLKKLSPALEQVDSSSGALGSAVNKAIEEMLPIIAKAPADKSLRNKWLDHLWQAIEEDDIPYLEHLADFWGEVCSTPEFASQWADKFIGMVRLMWSQNPPVLGGFKGTAACFSALFKAGRNEEILEMLKLSPFKFWSYHQWGVKALAAMGKSREAIQYAEDSHEHNNNPRAIAITCEEILLAEGLMEEAYKNYAFEANQKDTYLATFRAIVKKYPHKKVQEILSDLVASSPGNEGKWFASAKSAGLFREAIALANQSSCDPHTLLRSAKEMEEKDPPFAIEVGLAALKWMSKGFGYEITGLDVLSAYIHTMKAAEKVGLQDDVLERVRKIIDGSSPCSGLVAEVLDRHLKISTKK